MSKTLTSGARALILAIAFAGTLAMSGCTAPAISTTDTSEPQGSASASAAASASTEPVVAVDLAEGDQDEPVEVSVDGGVDGVGVTFREITIAPGASTGEHCHYGQLIGVVAEGELTHYSENHPGGVRVYTEGESLIEGAGYPHEGRNEGDEDLVLWVTYVTPEGKALAETDLTRCDD